MSRIKRGEHLAPQLLTWLAAAAGILTVGVVMTGCSLAPKEKRSIRVEIPRNTTIQEINASSKSDWVAQLPVPGFSAYSSYAPIPTSMAGIACLGMAVSAVDIADDPRVEKCPNEAVGKFAGLVSAVNGGSMEMLIAAGPARHVRIFGFSAIAGLGCPNMEDVLNNDSYKDSLGDPYLLAEQVVDLFEDKDIYLDAAFVSDRKLFQCGDKQDSVPLVIARKGRYPSPMNTSSPSAVYPTGPEGDGSFVGVPVDLSAGVPVDFSDSEKVLALNFADLLTGAVGTSANSVIHKYQAPSAETPKQGRAAIRLAFDATGYEQLPYMRVSLRYSGGRADCTNTVGTANVCGSAYAFLSDSSVNWAPLGNSDIGLYHASFHTLSSRHVMKFTNGMPTDNKPFILMNIESDTMTAPSITSEVTVEGVSVSLSAMPEPLEGQVSTGSGPMPTPGTVVNVPSNQNFYVYGWGGVAPYTWQITNGTSTIDGDCSIPGSCSGAMFAAPVVANGTTEEWTAKLVDFQNREFQFKVNVVGSNSVTGSLAFIGPPPSVISDPCSVPLTFESTFSAAQTINLSSTGISGAFYQTAADCEAGSNGVIQVNVPDSISTQNIFFRPAGDSVAGSVNIGVGTTDSSVSAAVSTYYLPYRAQLKISLADAATTLYQGECSKFIVELVDSALNPLSSFAHPSIPIAVTEGGGSYGRVYPPNDPTCATAGITANGSSVFAGFELSLADSSTSTWFYYRAQTIRNFSTTHQLAISAPPEMSVPSWQTGFYLESRQALLVHVNGIGGVDSFRDAKGLLMPDMAANMGSGDSTPVNVNQGYFGSSATDYGYVTFPYSLDWNFGSQDFTVEMWVKLATAPTVGSPVTLIGNYAPGAAGPPATPATGWVLMIDWQQGLGFTNGTDSLSEGLGDATAVANAYTINWQHVAVTKSGTTCRLFTNGQIVATQADCNGFLDSSNSLYIGSNQAMSGAMFPAGSSFDEVRIMKGVAIWTSAFTPQLYAY